MFREGAASLHKQRYGIIRWRDGEMAELSELRGEYAAGRPIGMRLEVLRGIHLASHSQTARNRWSINTAEKKKVQTYT